MLSPSVSRKHLTRLTIALTVVWCGGAGAQSSPGNAEASRPAALACAERSAALAAGTGRTITVRPAGDGIVSVDGATKTLRRVVSEAAPGEIIALEDGTYTLPAAPAGAYTGLYVTTPRVTLRSVSGHAGAVIIDSAYRSMGGQSAAITVAAPGVVLADFTVKRSVFHLIHFWADGDGGVVHNVRLVDGGQQFLKSSPGSGETVDSVEVSCSEFLMTAEGRANVWGYGAPHGNAACYTGGIDTHGGRDWHVHDNAFEGIYCDRDGAAHPAHRVAAELRAGMTYTGGLAEYAIHMWDAPRGHGHVIERNRIVNCARGIGVGLRADVHDSVIRNNIVASRHAGSREHDVGIAVARAHNTRIDNNTVIFTSPAAYPNAIEYRWPETRGLKVRNNLTNRRIRARNGATAATARNIEDASPAWFVDPARGDLHLASCGPARVVGAGTPLPGVTDDYDGQARGARNDIGADHCAAPSARPHAFAASSP